MFDGQEITVNLKWARSRKSDPAPFPHDRPAVEQGPGHGDGVEPLPVAGGFAPFEADRGHHRAGRGVLHPSVKPPRAFAPRHPGPRATVR